MRSRNFTYFNLIFTGLINYLFTRLSLIIYFNHFKSICMEQCLPCVLKRFVRKFYFSKARLVRNNEYTFFEVNFDSRV